MIRTLLTPLGLDESLFAKTFALILYFDKNILTNNTPMPMTNRLNSDCMRASYLGSNRSAIALSILKKNDTKEMNIKITSISTTMALMNFLKEFSPSFVICSSFI
jgi:hypothetical protein